MKKRYIIPSMFYVEIRTQQMLAHSLETEDSTYQNLAREACYDDEEYDD